MIQLEAREGQLLLPKNQLLVAYGLPEVAFPKWPNPDREVLVSALVDARELGRIPDNAMKVLLPDGEVFDIDYGAIDPAEADFWRNEERLENMGVPGIDY